MSLKPKRVNFEETWMNLKQTVKDVITMGNVNKTVWNDRFLYVFYTASLSGFLWKIPHFLHNTNFAWQSW